MADLQPRESGDCVEDRLSQLPNGILSHILSFLPMKDAARTSVLSRDWIRRWLSVDQLYFDVRELFEDEVLWFFTAGIAANMARHAQWVTSVLRAHQEAMLMDGEDVSSVIKKLRVRMPMCKTYQENVNEWISYAFARKVETLELRLASQYARCSFPTGLMDRNLDCLKSLSLVGLNVTGEDVKVFLRKLRFLEYLKLCLSDALETVEVCGSSLALKHLEILDCPNLRYAIVWNTRLVSLTLTWLNRVVLGQNPNLVVLRAGGWIRDAPAKRILKQLSDCFPRLESLTLEADFFDEAEVIAEIPRLSELKQLTIVGNPGRTETLNRITALLSLSPKLQKLTLEFGDRHGWDFAKMDYLEALNSGNRPMIPLKHLRSVEVREYNGDEAEDGLLRYLFKYVVAPIATVTYDPNNLHREMPVRPRRSTNEMGDVDHAVQLQRVIPPAVKFNVITTKEYVGTH